MNVCLYINYRTRVTVSELDARYYYPVNRFHVARGTVKPVALLSIKSRCFKYFYTTKNQNTGTKTLYHGTIDLAAYDQIIFIYIYIKFSVIINFILFGWLVFFCVFVLILCYHVFGEINNIYTVYINLHLS